MQSLFEFIFTNLKDKPETHETEKLNFHERKQYLTFQNFRKKQEECFRNIGLELLEVTPLIYQFVELPLTIGKTWAELELLHQPLSVEHSLCFWCNKLEQKLKHPDIITLEIESFNNWFNTCNEKYPKLNTECLSREKLLNIWVDYAVTKTAIEQIEQAPIILKQGFLDNLIEISVLLMNVTELFQKNMTDFNEGKSMLFGKGKETSKFRVAPSVLKEIAEIIENIKDLNKRYLNTPLEQEHLQLLQDELAKLNLVFFQKATLKKIRETVNITGKISQRMHYDILNDFLLALGFPGAISEEDELSFLKRENCTMDTIRQMKKRLIEGLEK